MVVVIDGCMDGCVCGDIDSCGSSGDRESSQYCLIRYSNSQSVSQSVVDVIDR